MLAQNFKPAVELGLATPEHQALITVLGMMERKELRHVAVTRYLPSVPIVDRQPGLFNMAHWSAETSCGTVCCIKGTAEIVLGRPFYMRGLAREYYKPLWELFIPGWPLPLTPQGKKYFDLKNSITVEQAAHALRNYLTLGRAHWENVLRWAKC